jgi:hypothetical protein
MNSMLRIALAASACALTLPAAAAVTQGDFRSESDLPDYSAAGPMVLERTGSVLAAGYELDTGDFVENPAGWGGGYVHVDWNSTTNILTLDSQDDWDFQTYKLVISNILFDSAQTITGITLLTDDLTDADDLVPTLSFTDSSVTIFYNYVPNVFDFTGGSATFQVTLGGAGAVPEPATWGMMILGLGLVGASMRRRSTTVSFA